VRRLRLTAIGIAGLLLAPARTASATCADLAALKLANTTITVQSVAAGAFVLPQGVRAPTRRFSRRSTRLRLFAAFRV